jgi:formate-dependent nitrite reductase membrane component NrfD
LKPPVWTWEVPLYFFVGGVAGLAALIALVASLVGSDPSTAQAARWVAAAGAAVSPLLLISDLGRPARFIYMLRVFKPASAMSMGAWTLVVFSAAALAALGLHLLAPSTGIVRAALAVVDVVAAATGIVLATYTGVLLGATVIPVWARHHRWLPFEFGISSLGAAASVVELVGGFTPPLQRAAVGAAAIKTALWLIELRSRQNRAASGDRRPGRTVLVATALSGPLALVLRLVGFAVMPARMAAALAAIAGSLLLRYGWLAAGRVDVTSMRK